MKAREIDELARILVQERGREARRIVTLRRSAHPRGSEMFRLWQAIGRAADRLLRRRVEPIADRC